MPELNGDQNLTKEREVDDGVIITEYHDFKDVTAKSDVDAGLGNCVYEALDERAGLPVGELATTEMLRLRRHISTNWRV